MSGNTFGRFLSLTSFGESHGPAMGGILDGLPSRIRIDEAFIQQQLNRRRPGQSKYTTQRREADTIKILSGVLEGQSLGSSIGFLIENTDVRSKDYDAIKNVFRPGHGDYTYSKKYGIRDPRGGGRASARETVIRVAGGAIAQLFLRQHFGIEITGYLSQMGSLKIDSKRFDKQAIEENDFFCPDPQLVPELEAMITSLRKEGDSIGAQVTVEATNVPAGLGEPVFHRLDADLASGLMSINAVKGVGIGSGFDCVTQKGSEHRDEMNEQGFLTNDAGGILAGISTGQPIVATLALKPTSSIMKPGQTLTEAGETTQVQTKGRHDPCVGIRAVPIAQAMVALVLADHILQVYGNRFV